MTKAWNKALTHMKSALRLLDDAEAPPEIGANLDSTICRLEEAIAAQRRITLPVPPPGRATAGARSNHP